MCSVHGSVCHDGQVLPKDPGAGECKPPYVFLIWCYVIVLGFLFTGLEAHTGLYLGVIVLPGKASWHWLLKVTFFFFYFGLISRSARDNPIMGRANVNVATRAAAKSDHRIFNFLVFLWAHGTTSYGGMCTALLQKGSSKM